MSNPPTERFMEHNGRTITVRPIGEVRDDFDGYITMAYAYRADDPSDPDFPRVVLYVNGINGQDGRCVFFETEDALALSRLLYEATEQRP